MPNQSWPGRSVRSRCSSATRSSTDSGINEYLVNFPLRASLRIRPTGRGSRITGEASGEYLYYPTAPERIADLVPDVRLIVLLRDPVDRAVSHYFHNIKLGLEDLSLEEALKREESWKCEESPDTGPVHRKFGALGSSRAYMGRSMYARHLERWFEHFDPSQLLALEAESLYEDPAAAMAAVCSFLGFQFHPDRHFERHNAGRRTSVEHSLIERMTDGFVNPNRELNRQLEARLGDRQPLLRWTQ